MFQKSHTKSYREQYDFEWGKGMYHMKHKLLHRILHTFAKLKNTNSDWLNRSLGNYLTDVVAGKKVQFDFCKH